MYKKGTTLIETLVASAIFLVISLAIYQLYVKIIEFSASIRTTTVATQIAGEHIEFIRNLQYADVGTVSGIPSGVVPQQKTITRNGVTFRIDTVIRNVDFVADGTLGGTPNDLSPADNKLVTVEVTCTTCKIPKAVTHTSYVAPKSLETENGNGALVIKAIDANGVPVTGATVLIENIALTPAVNMTDVTDAYGVLTIVDAPPSSEKYAITVSKAGYSTEKTYEIGLPANPNPNKPHATVVQNTVTQATFAIDRTSEVTMNITTNQCTTPATIGGNLEGSKTIGTNPTVIKNRPAFTTAQSTLSNIEWDTYGITLSSGGYDIAAVNPILPLTVIPNTPASVQMMVKPTLPNRLVIAVADGSGNPLDGATVSVSGISTSKITSPSMYTQTDWSGGDGQISYVDQSRFFTGNNIDVTSSGVVRLSESSNVYSSNGTLTSSTIDFGSTVTLTSLNWEPTSQPALAGTDSIRFQLAVNTDNATWDFHGPDGTVNTFYTASGATLPVTEVGRYVRYKAFLSTADQTVSPSISEVSISACVPAGHVDFAGLADGAYTITVSKSGYTTAVKTITINSNWYEAITLTP